mmetsp:Transcript_27202/g.63337  ORF Transcript_27202/g.63337 Transcript_27202/m.63337 type:complete len:519 (+) Transcript_27202:74-1630(+)
MDGSFTKVSSDALRDDEDERRDMVRKANSIYKKAQDGYYAGGAGAEQLQRFAEAEAAIAPLLSGGLMGLREEELQMVLKGRLHQAVILAHLQDSDDCWMKVKALVEDVLQFDFQNCHARWLRGLSLLHGLKKTSEAKQEMQRAIDYARATGKTGEVKMWDEQIHTLFTNGDDQQAAQNSASAAAGSPPGPQIEEIVEEPQASSRDASTEAKLNGSTLQKGFFNRAAGKPAAKKGASQRKPEPAAEIPQPAAAEDVSKSSSSTSRVPSTSTSGTANGSSHEATLKMHIERQQELEQREQALHAQVAKLEAEIDQLRKDKAAEAATSEKERQLEMKALGDEFTKLFEEQKLDPCKAKSTKQMSALGASLAKLTEHFQADKAWSEGKQQKYSDFSTEVLTLREMLVREFKDQKDASKKHVDELKDTTSKLVDLKGVARLARDRIRSLVHTGEDATLDEQHFASCASNFQSLPLSVKLKALLDDSVVLWLLAFVMLIGMLTTCAIIVEVFGARQCRIACLFQ